MVNTHATNGACEMECLLRIARRCSTSTSQPNAHEPYEAPELQQGGPGPGVGMLLSSHKANKTLKPQACKPAAVGL